MSTSKVQQVSLREALAFEEQEHGVYKGSVSAAFCFGIVVSGGIVTAIAQKCAKHYCAKTPKSANHKDVWRLSVNFYRPVLGETETIVTARLNNGNKLWTTIRVEVKQNDKVCLDGDVTLTDMSLPGKLTVPTGWQLTPPPVPADIELLKNDTSSTHFGSTLRWEATKSRRAATYITFYLPEVQRAKNEFDEWVTPAWQDDGLSDGPVWDNDNLHFLIDTSLPLTNSLIQNPKTPGVTWHEVLVRQAIAQRQARREGRSDAIAGAGGNDDDLIPLIFATVSITTEQIKPLPKEGTKWLFMRVTTRTLINDRMNLDVKVLDDRGELVAVSNYIMQVVPSAAKRQKKEKKHSAL